MSITYRQLYLDARCQLRDAGIEAAALEARELICFASGLNRTALLRNDALPVPNEIVQRVQKLTRRHIDGEPVAYLIGEWDFYGLTLDVSRETLIPRPDTEILSEQAISFCQTLNRSQILDLCAGSGCIGLSIASQVSDAVVLLGELYDAPLTVCRRNIQRCGLESRVTVRRLNALETPPDNLGTFRCIVCNPPYIPTGDLAGLDRSVRDYEPHTALDGGADGLVFYRSIAEKWKTVLAPSGRLYFEVGIHQAEAVRAILEQHGFQNIQITPDLSGIPRVVSGIRI